jgi:5-(carboxyamino)imidazole ribonucleotide mutase
MRRGLAFKRLWLLFAACCLLPARSVDRQAHARTVKSGVLRQSQFSRHLLQSDSPARHATIMPNPSTPASSASAAPLIGVVMGSSSDWDTMRHAVDILQQFGVPHEARVVSAHRMPDELFAYAEGAAGRGLQAIIAGAGGAAHLPGMLAAKTALPVLGVPVATKHLQGVDSLHSIVQMPKGVPVATFAIGTAGAANAALFAVAMLALHDAALAGQLAAFRAAQTAAAQAMTLPPA